jgi:hypothetical protein
LLTIRAETCSTFALFTNKLTWEIYKHVLGEHHPMIKALYSYYTRLLRKEERAALEAGEE